MSLDGERIVTPATFSRPEKGTTESTICVEANGDSVTLWVSSAVGILSPRLLPSDVEALCEELTAAAEELDEEAVDDRRRWLELNPRDEPKAPTGGGDQ